MPIISRENLFVGVNPLLNSFLQQPMSSWKSFHYEFVAELRDTLAQDAFEKNFNVLAEQGIQISETSLEYPATSKPSPEIISKSSINGESVEHLYPIPLKDSGYWEEYLPCVQISINPLDTEPQLLTVIEFIGLNTKLSESYRHAFRLKRQELLAQGINFVHIDFVHEHPPLIHGVPAYSYATGNSEPYHIGISKPRKKFQAAEYQIYNVKIDQALPKLPVPLAGKDFIVCDLQAVYNRAYQGRRHLNLQQLTNSVDYSQEPLNLNRYHRPDQKQIISMLETIRNAPSAPLEL